MIASPGGRHVAKSLKNLLSMRKRMLASFSCEKTRLRVSRSAAPKPFAKGFSAEERAFEKNQLNDYSRPDSARSCCARARRTSKAPDLGRCGFTGTVAQSRVETSGAGDPQAARNV